MAKTILSYTVNSNLKKLIEQKAEKENRKLSHIEKELAKQCELKPGTIKKYKDNNIIPCLPVALKIGRYFRTSTEKIWELKEV